jgi:hypothetical protein
VSERDDFAAYLRTLNVPRNMANCQRFVNYLIAQVENPPPSAEVLQQLRDTVTHQSAALLEIINALEPIERWIIERSS